MPNDNVIERILQNARQELLDLSARNRLISTPRDSNRSKRLEIVDERSEELFRLLVRERSALSFLPAHEGEEAVEGDQPLPGLLQPEDDAVPTGGEPDARHTDRRLQTRLGSERLQTRLLDLYSDAQTYEEEQGVSILYLALGFLKWYESASSDRPRYAPLLLIPVTLSRASVGARFKLGFRDEDVTTNLSLQAKLDKEFQLKLPDVPDIEDLSPEAYFTQVEQAIATQQRWAVLRNDVVLWFFSFAKYLMYRDLEPKNWPEHSPLAGSPLLKALLQQGFGTDAPICGEDDCIDDVVAAENMVHVSDADSSQTLVIEEVRRGRNLVVQGPPGTGKSQTITNMIAAAVREGKRVLFVAEKMAALEVVKGRLDRLGLGALCLELHSHNANKRAVLDDLSRTLSLGRPKAKRMEAALEALCEVRTRLNRHATLMNAPLDPAGITPFQVLGKLVALENEGQSPAGFRLPDAAKWTRPEYREMCGALDDLRTHLCEIGEPSKHPWRGVGLQSPPLPTDVKQVQSRLADLRSVLRAVGEAVRTITADLHIRGQEEPHLRAGQLLARLTTRVLEAPSMDRAAMANAVWESEADGIADLVGQGQQLSRHQDRLQGVVADVAWETDLSTARRCLAAYGRSWLRWLRRDYRDAVAALRGVLASPLPGTLAERLELLDTVTAAQRLGRRLASEEPARRLGAAAFGNRWKGAESDWMELAAIVAWDKGCREDKLPKAYRKIVARGENIESCRGPLQQLRDNLNRADTQLPDLLDALRLDSREAFGIDDVRSVPLSAWIDRIDQWEAAGEALSKWVAYAIRRARIAQKGLQDVCDRLHTGAAAADSAVALFQLAYHESLIRALFDEHPELGLFDGRTYEQWIERFRALDRERIEMSRLEVALAHYDRIPRGAVGEPGVIHQEIQKKRRLKPIRQLLREAGNAVSAVKPVFMMSPVSVAQFLEPGALDFDLLLIDEASQVSPVDAFGAIARARQIVVVGDSKQLPPTRFFTKMLDDDTQAEDDDGVHAGDLESVLGLCLSQGVQPRMLRWHYRSRHQSLIEVSNREFYDNRLYVVPSPQTTTNELGLTFRHVAAGAFDRGGTRTNRVEAGEVARAIVEQARRFPDKSLGVGAFSVSQRDAIRDELELLLRQERNLDDFFARGRTEPFFIKNLENIQGDERDVILISVGYARDPSGFLAMNFGPLSSDGGERRLNVLISRARERCEVFSSITADDIDLERGRSRGVAAFKSFLRFAQTGNSDVPTPLGRDFDSDFERQVAQALVGLGFDVHCQIGTTGFIIDLAVIDPSRPGRYLLGVECDGATYHSSRSARDRDRLREQVLKDRGWRIHRIWSTDWFQRPKEQLQKVLGAIETAKADVAAARFGDDARRSESTVDGNGPTVSSVEIPRDSSANDSQPSDASGWSIPYVEAVIPVPSHMSIPDTPVAELSRIVTEIVVIEAPIHREELARRITTLWGQQRTGSRIALAIEQALSAAQRDGRVRFESDFVLSPLQKDVPVRNRQEVISTQLRKPELLPPQEIRRAISRLVTDHVGMRREELHSCVSRLLGFKSTSAHLRELIDRETDALIARGWAAERDGKLFAEGA